MVSTTEDQFEHIAPLAVMRFLDGDMTEVEGAAFEQHLSSCDVCHALFLQTQNQLSQLSGVSDIDGARSEERRLDATMHLEAELSKLAIEGSRPSWFRAAGGKWFAYAGCAAAILIVAISVQHKRASSLPGENQAALLPDKVLTPGAVRPVTVSQLCETSDDDLDPGVAAPTKNEVFQEYGIRADRQRKYFQVDYLINPQLGGVEDVRNLWPQPYTSQWNAEAKDALERRLHRMVCERQIELADAQHEIASNWIDAYKKYFHTSKPI